MRLTLHWLHSIFILAQRMQILRTFLHNTVSNTEKSVAFERFLIFPFFPSVSPSFSLFFSSGHWSELDLSGRVWPS